ncbi:MAG TPA: MBL fold metallo-hydrolase, partial [Myxococcales bacterium]|nr:MBL fold metallo-hydrolase [Myxococcales bacterium]
TPGSTAYLWKDLLFTGDALMGQGAAAVTTAPWVFSEDASGARRSLEKLRDVPFTRMADGHVGATADARMRLLRFLSR